MLTFDRLNDNLPRQAFSEVELLEPDKWFYFHRASYIHGFRNALRHAAEVLPKALVLPQLSVQTDGKILGAVVSYAQIFLAIYRSIRQVDEDFRSPTNTIECTLYARDAHIDISDHFHFFRNPPTVTTAGLISDTFIEVFEEEPAVQLQCLRDIQETLSEWQRSRATNPGPEMEMDIADNACSVAFYTNANKAAESYGRLLKHVRASRTQETLQRLAENAERDRVSRQGEYTYEHD